MKPDADKATYRLDWQEVRHDWPAWLALVGSFVAGILLYPALPERVPIHWNLAGQVDGYGSRAMGAFFLPVMNLATYKILLLIPLVDPKRANYARFASFYRGVRIILTFFLAVLHAVTLFVALGRPVDLPLVVSLGMSLLFLYLGHSLSRVQQNYFFGIRTPWTLADEEVWRRTHRLGGRLFMAIAVLPWLTWPFARQAASLILLFGVAAAAMATILYSAVLYHRTAGRQ